MVCVYARAFATNTNIDAPKQMTKQKKKRKKNVPLCRTKLCALHKCFENDMDTVNFVRQHDICFHSVSFKYRHQLIPNDYECQRCRRRRRLRSHSVFCVRRRNKCYVRWEMVGKYDGHTHTNSDDTVSLTLCKIRVDQNDTRAHKHCFQASARTQARTQSRNKLVLDRWINNTITLRYLAHIQHLHVCNIISTTVKNEQSKNIPVYVLHERETHN